MIHHDPRQRTPHRPVPNPFIRYAEDAGSTYLPPREARRLRVEDRQRPNFGWDEDPRR